MKAAIIPPGFNQPLENNYHTFKINELSAIEDASLDEINIFDCADFLPFEQRDGFITNAVGKLKIGGKIIISGLDPEEISKYMITSINVQQFNFAIYNLRQSCNTIENMKNNLYSYNIILVNCKIDGIHYSIIGRRGLKPNEN